MTNQIARRTIAASLSTVALTGVMTLSFTAPAEAAGCRVGDRDRYIGKKVDRNDGRVMSVAKAWRKPSGTLVLQVSTPTNQEVRMDRRYGGPRGDRQVVLDPNDDGKITICKANTDLKVEVSAFTVNRRGQVTSLTDYLIAQPGRLS